MNENIVRRKPILDSILMTWTIDYGFGNIGGVKMMKRNSNDQTVIEVVIEMGEGDDYCAHDC